MTKINYLEDWIYICKDPVISNDWYFDEDDEDDLEKVKSFKEVWIWSAYETDHTFIFDVEPIELPDHLSIGSWFNYWSTNILNIPDGINKILILAEND